MRLNFSSNNTSSNQPASIIGKIFTSLFLSVFAGMGTFFLIIMIREFFTQEKKDWVMIPFMLIPIIFMLVGFGGIYGVWFVKKSKESKASKAGHKINERLFLILFGLVFFGAGMGIAWPFLFRPLINYVDARDWVQTPCTVLSAEVGVHGGDDGDTYSIDIAYEYTFDGRTYRSERYDFINVNSSGYHGKKSIVDRYQNAAETVCYVNPERPDQAVLERGLTLRNAIGLFPIPFIGAGAAIMIYGLRYRPRAGRQSWMPVACEDNLEGSTLLKPASTPLKKLAFAIVFCLFWNGIVSVFVTEAVKGFASGHPEWCLVLFMIPFVLVGLGAMVAVIYCSLALLNPKYLLMLMPEQVYSGTQCLIGWKAFGKAGRIRNLTLKLIGREEATYRRGTDTVTDKRNFFELELVNTADPFEIAKSEAEFTIPADTMHSFEADNNKIVWLFELEGDIHHWPDVKHEYKFTIVPQPITEEDLS